MYKSTFYSSDKLRQAILVRAIEKSELLVTSVRLELSNNWVQELCVPWNRWGNFAPTNPVYTDTSVRRKNLADGVDSALYRESALI